MLCSDRAVKTLIPLTLIGMGWFIVVTGAGFILAVGNAWISKPDDRADLIQKLKKHWRWAIIFSVLFILNHI